MHSAAPVGAAFVVFGGAAVLAIRSRLHGFVETPRLAVEAVVCGAVGGVCIAFVAMEAAGNRWLAAVAILPFGLMVSAIAVSLWTSIPRKVAVSDLEQAVRTLGGGRFVLILWSTRAYRDHVGEKYIGMVPTWGGMYAPGFAPRSWDHEVVSAASELGCRTLRLSIGREGAFVGQGRKSLLVTVTPGKARRPAADRPASPSKAAEHWRRFVLEAMHHATAILVYPGPGDGLAWELEVLRANDELRAKAAEDCRSPEAAAAALKRLLAK